MWLEVSLPLPLAKLRCSLAYLPKPPVGVSAKLQLRSGPFTVSTSGQSTDIELSLGLDCLRTCGVREALSGEDAGACKLG